MASAHLPQTGLEGESIGAITGIATFTDPAGDTNPSDFTATVNWGDGTTDVGTIQLLSSGAGGSNFEVNAPAHTYIEEGTYSETVTLHHNALPAVTTPQQTISIADQQVTVPVVTPPVSPLEGQATAASFDLATFTDPAGLGLETPADFGAVITWGDGTTSTGTIKFDNSTAAGANYEVDAPSHTYVEEGTYTISVSVSHDLLLAVTGSSSVIVADQQITNLTDENLPANGLEEVPVGAITPIATFTDPAGVGNETPSGDFTATINWGDSTTSTGTIVFVNSTAAGANYAVDAPTHTYVEEGTYTETVTVTHDLLAPVTSTGQSIVVADQQITTPVDANLPANGLEGAPIGAITGIATFTDPAGVGDETPSGDFTAVINWGDSTTSTGTIVFVNSTAAGANYAVNAPTHTYVEEGTYTETVTVKHDLLPAVMSAGQSIVVADQQITNLTDANAPTGAGRGAHWGH